jgi:hypothetical protein
MNSHAGVYATVRQAPAKALSLVHADGEFEVVSRHGTLLFSGTAERCRDAANHLFGRGHWIARDGTVLRGGEDGDPPLVVAEIRAVTRPD